MNRSGAVERQRRVAFVEILREQLAAHHCQHGVPGWTEEACDHHDGFDAGALSVCAAGRGVEACERGEAGDAAVGVRDDDYVVVGFVEVREDFGVDGGLVVGDGG